MNQRSRIDITPSRGLLAALVALACSPATAGGLLGYEIGTGDMGFATAGYAVRASDASTAFTNPAGMTQLDGTQVLVGAQLLYTNLKFSIDPSTSSALGSGDGGHAGGKSGFFPGGGLFISYSLSPDLKLGFASTGNFGAALKFDDAWVGRYYGQQSTLIGASFIPSVAYKVNDKLSIGVGINAMYGYLKSVTAVNNIVPGQGDGKLKLRDTTWGWGGNVGVLYQVDPSTRIGATYNSQVKLDFNAPAEFSNLGPGLSAALNAKGLLNANIKMGVTVPQQLMFSALHVVDPQWTVYGDAGWQEWSKFGELEVGVDSNNPTSVTTNIPFKNTWHGAVGAQYQLNEPWRINFGVAYDSKFQSGAYVSPILPANDAWRFGFGVHQQVSKSFSWGVAGQYLYGGSLDVNRQAAVPVAAGGRGNLVGTYKNIGTLFSSVSLNWAY